MSEATPVSPPRPRLRPPAARRRRPVIRVRHLNHYFGEGELRKQVLFDNNLEVARGEIVIMTGPSGSGKTTLLTLIGALRTVQEGSAEVLGHELRGASHVPSWSPSAASSGFIFQAHNLFQSLTAFQNVRMALELFLAGRGRGQPAHHRAAHPSGPGAPHPLQARLALRRPETARGGRPGAGPSARRLILADEPTAALDEKSGRDVVTLFQRFTREDNCTIIMVTHDNRILDVADRIVNMIDGRIKSNVLVRVSAEICEFLRNVPVFQHLTPQTLSEVADQMKIGEASGRGGYRGPGRRGRQVLLDSPGQRGRQTDGREGARASGGRPGRRSILRRSGPPDRRTPQRDGRRPGRYGSLYPQQRRLPGGDPASASFEEEIRKALFQRQ